MLSRLHSLLRGRRQRNQKPPPIHTFRPGVESLEKRELLSINGVVPVGTAPNKTLAITCTNDNDVVRVIEKNGKIIVKDHQLTTGAYLARQFSQITFHGNGGTYFPHTSLALFQSFPGAASQLR